MRRLFVPFLAALIFVVSCGKKDQPIVTSTNQVPADSVAIDYYKLRSEGRFAEYVSAMLSCDGTTPEYKKSMEQMLRQHQCEIEKEKKGVSHVEALRTELHDNGKMANVFLRVTYNDGSCEEILFPLVDDGQNWRIQ